MRVTQARNCGHTLLCSCRQTRVEKWRYDRDLQVCAMTLQLQIGHLISRYCCQADMKKRIFISIVAIQILAISYISANIYKKKEYEKYVSYRCPAEITPALESEMIRLSKKAFYALGCRDFARADFRVDEQGRIFFIEINPLPGLAPHYSDYPMLAEFCGVAYDDLVGSVLRAGAVRCGVSL